MVNKYGETITTQELIDELHDRLVLSPIRQRAARAKREFEEARFNATWKLIEDKEHDAVGYLDPYFGWRYRVYKHRFKKDLYHHEWYLPRPKHPNCRCTIRLDVDGHI